MLDRCKEFNRTWTTTSTKRSLLNREMKEHTKLSKMPVKEWAHVFLPDRQDLTQLPNNKVTSVGNQKLKQTSTDNKLWTHRTMNSNNHKVTTVKTTEVFWASRMLLKWLRERIVSRINQLNLRSILTSSKLDQLMLSNQRLFKRRTILQLLTDINSYQTTWSEPRICQMDFLEELPVETKEHRKVLVLWVTTMVEDQTQETLATNILLFKSQMKETNQLRVSTSTTTPRCNPWKMDLLQELEKLSKLSKLLAIHQLLWATTTVIRIVWLRTRALELIKPTNWLVRFITQLRKNKVTLKATFMLIITALSIEPILLNQILTKRCKITRLKITKKERIQSSKWSRVDLKCLEKLDKDLKWPEVKC